MFNGHAVPPTLSQASVGFPPSFRPLARAPVHVGARQENSEQSDSAGTGSIDAIEALDTNGRDMLAAGRFNGLSKVGGK